MITGDWRAVPVYILLFAIVSDDLVSILQGIRETVRRGRDNRQQANIENLPRYSSVSCLQEHCFSERRELFSGRNVISRMMIRSFRLPCRL